MRAGNALLNGPALCERLGICEGQHLAELGAGRLGHVAMSAAHVVGDTGHVFAVDLIPHAVTALKKRILHSNHRNMSAVWGDYQTYQGIDLPGGILDHIVLVNELWKTDAPEKMAQEWRRLLKPGGVVTLVDWHPNSIHPVAPLAEYRRELLPMMRLFARGGAQVQDLKWQDPFWAMQLAFKD
jgi:ubiquinone/menaquinone biosynthesis C-methylase UbiE